MAKDDCEYVTLKIPEWEENPFFQDIKARATTQHVQPILQPVQRVTFNLDCNRVYDLPPEDRKSDWIQIAADRFRFQRRIRHLENILGPLLLKRKTLKH